jgi:hypothetical protein
MHDRGYVPDGGGRKEGRKVGRLVEGGLEGASERAGLPTCQRRGSRVGATHVHRERTRRRERATKERTPCLPVYAMPTQSTNSLSRLPSHLNGDAPQPQQLTPVPSWTLHDTGMLHGRAPRWATMPSPSDMHHAGDGRSLPNQLVASQRHYVRLHGRPTSRPPPPSRRLALHKRAPPNWPRPRCTGPAADLQKRGPGIEYSKTAKLLFHEALRHLKLPLPPQICVSYPQSPNFHSAQSLDVETALLRGRPSHTFIYPI